MSARRQRRRIAGTLTATALGGAILAVALRIGLRPAPIPEVGDAPLVMQQGIVSAPDISTLSPRERAVRLYKRVLRLHDEHKADSIAFFAPMALAAYEDVPDRDAADREAMTRIVSIARRDAAPQR